MDMARLPQFTKDTRLLQGIQQLPLNYPVLPPSASSSLFRKSQCTVWQCNLALVKALMKNWRYRRPTLIVHDGSPGIGDFVLGSGRLSDTRQLLQPPRADLAYEPELNKRGPRRRRLICLQQSGYTTLKITIYYTRALTERSSVFGRIEATPWAPIAIIHPNPTLISGRPRFQNIFNNAIGGALSLRSGGTVSGRVAGICGPVGSGEGVVRSIGEIDTATGRDIELEVRKSTKEYLAGRCEQFATPAIIAPHHTCIISASAVRPH